MRRARSSSSIYVPFIPALVRRTLTPGNFAVALTFFKKALAPVDVLPA